MPYSATYRSTLHRDVSDALNIAADAPDEVKRWGIGVLAGGIMPGQHLGANAWQDADGTLNRLKEVYRTGSMEAMFTEGFRESERLLKEGNWDELERLGKGSGSIWRKLDPVEPGRIASLLDDPDREEFERLRRVREEHTGADADPRAINRYNELVAEGTKRDRAMRYVEKQRQENAFAMLAAITPDLTPEAMGVIERAVANDYRIADEDEGAFLTEEKGGLPRSQKELVAAYLGYCKPTHGAGAWGQFMQRMWEQAWDVTRHTGEEISDLFNLAMHRSFRRGGYREVLEQRAYLQQINQKNFADLGFWGNSFAEAGGILGYWTPMIASLFLTKGVGSLAGVKAAGAAGSIARGVGMAGRVAGPMVSHGMFVSDFRQQFLQRIALDGGDPTALGTQAAAWIGAIAADAVEHIAWGQMVGKTGMAEVQSQAYSKLVHSAAARFGKKMGVEFGKMGLGEAAVHVLAERGITTVFEAVEEALQQAIEEVVVDIGDGRTVRLGNLLEQSYGAFKATLGPMMLTALNPFAMAGRARSAVTMRNLDGDAIDRMMSSGERLKQLAAEGRLVRSDEDMGVLGGLMRMTAQAATEEDAQRALLERGFSAGQANTMLRTFAAIRRSAIEHGQTGELGPAMLQADEELARAGFSLSENPDGTTTATRIQTDGQGNKRRQTLKIAWGAFRELDMTSPAEVGSALDYIRQNASEGTKTTLRTLGLDIARPNVEIMADAAAMNALGLYVAENELGDVANSLATGTTKSKEADGTEIDEDTYTITLTEKATRESIWHEVGHAAGYALRRMGLSEEEIDAIQNWRSGEDGKAPSEADMALPEHAGAGGTEFYGEERVNYELAGEIARKNEPKTAFARGLEYVGDLVRNVLRIRKKAEEDGNAAAIMTELIWHGHLGKLDTLNDAQKRVLLEARRRRQAAETGGEAPPSPEGPSSAGEGPSSAAEGTKPATSVRPPDERTVANFCFDRPILRDDMARLAASGELSEDDIFETGYRWSPFLRAWVVQPELKGQKFTPNGRYMGLDGEWHGEEARAMVASAAQHSISALEDIAAGKEYGILHNAMYGEIRYPLGKLGRIRKNGKTKGGLGLLHIVSERMRKDGATVEEAIETALRVGIAAEIGEETARIENTRWLDFDGTRAIIALTENGNPIITGYEINADETPAAFPSSEALPRQPLMREADIVAALKERLARKRQNVNSEVDEESGFRRMYAAAQNLPSPEFAMDGTIVDALPAHLREDARAIVAERGGTAAWMVEVDGTPTELNEREWLRREAERRHGERRYAFGGIYSGGTGDYANKSRVGGVGDGPSLRYVGTGDGSAAFGYGLYGSTGRNVAESYAEKGVESKLIGSVGKFELLHNGEPLHWTEKQSIKYNAHMGSNGDEKSIALYYLSKTGSVKKAIAAIVREDKEAEKSGFALHRWEGGGRHRYADAIRWLNEHGKEYKCRKVKGFVYERTFFTNRATPAETERHLLHWYEELPNEQFEWIKEALKSTNIDLEISYGGGIKHFKFVRGDEVFRSESNHRDYSVSIFGANVYGAATCAAMYKALEVVLGTQKAASELLVKAGLDGIKYPIGSIHGKTQEGFNLVSFRDDNIRVDHKWVDGEQRYQIAGALGAGRLGNRRLADAEAMERSGATREDIWWDTGWWRGADGEWRVEIADIQAKKEGGEIHIDGEDAWCTLGDMVEAPELFAAYPGIEETRINLVDPGTLDDAGGYYLSGQITMGWDGIAWNGDGMTTVPNQQGVQTLTHEIQHMLQEAEEFAGGTNVEAERRRLHDERNKSANDARLNFEEAIIAEITDALPAGELEDDDLYERYAEAATAAIAELEKAIRTNAKRNAAPLVKKALKGVGVGEKAAKEAAARLAQDFDKWRNAREDEEVDIWDARRAYLTSPGEVEARVAEARRKLPTMYRVRIPPWVTERIVRRDNYFKRADRSLSAHLQTMREMQKEEGGVRRHAVAPAGEQKQAGTAYPDAGGEIGDRRFAVGAKRLADYKALLEKKRPDLDARKVLAELDKYGNPKKEKVALHWVVAGAIRLPEDEYKVDEALSVAEKAKVDPFGYASPMELIEAHKEFKPTAKAIDPDTVPELSDRREMGYGVVTYLVQDTREGQAAMRRIIDTHWGEDANPWCLLARQEERRDSRRRTPVREEEALAKAFFFWRHYSALPKRVAFKDGKLLAFMATSAEANGFRVAINGKESSPYGYQAFVQEQFGDLEVRPGVGYDDVINWCIGQYQRRGKGFASVQVGDLVRRERSELKNKARIWTTGDAPVELTDAEITGIAISLDEAGVRIVQDIKETWWDRKDESHPDLEWARDERDNWDGRDGGERRSAVGARKMTPAEIARSVRFFGTTTDARNVAFVTPDGKWLDYDQMGEHWEISQALNPGHEAQLRAMKEFEGDVWPYVDAALKAGLVRASQWPRTMDGRLQEMSIQFGTQPTGACLKSVIKMLEQCADIEGGRLGVTVEYDGEGGRWWRKYERDDLKTCIRHLKAFGQTGKAPARSMIVRGGEEGEARYMVSPTLASDVAEALEKDGAGHYKKSAGAGIRYATSLPIMDFLGIRMNGIFTTADRIRKMVTKHFLTPDQVRSLAEESDHPAAVFTNVDGKGSHVILTGIMAPSKENGQQKPVMVLLRPEKGGSGGYIASAYSRRAETESAYISWRRHLRYIDKEKIAGLGLEGETDSQLEPQASGNQVLTPLDYSRWSTSGSQAYAGTDGKSESGARPAVGGRIREYDREAPYSPRGQLAALATMYLIQGKEPDRGNLQQIKERLGEQGDLDAIIAEAKETHGRILADLKAKGRKATAGEIAREAARRAKAAHPEDLLEEAFNRGAAAGTWAQGARGAVLSALIEKGRSDSYHDFALEMGLDIAGIYHRFTLQQARKDEAAAGGKGGETDLEDQTLENEVGFAEGAQGPLDPNSAAGQALSELERQQQENIERALLEADMDWEERNRLREERRQRRLEREREAEENAVDDGPGEGEGGEAVEDTPEGMDENDLAVDILERNQVDIRDPWKFALFLRKAIRNRILKANGLSVEFGSLEEALAAEERLWQNPTNTAMFAKSMAAILRDMAARLMDHAGETYPAVLVKLEQLSRMQNVRAIEIQAAFEIATIARRSIRETTGKMVEQTRTRLQKSYIGKHRFGEHDELEEDLKRKITGHVRRMAIWYKRVLGLTEGGIEREREKLMDRLSERNRALDEAAAQGVSAAKADEDAVATETLWKLKALDSYGGTRYLLPGEARERLMEMERWMATEGLKQAARIEEASRRYEKDRETIIKGCTVRDPATGEERTHEEDSKLDRFWRMTVNTINQRFRLLFARASGQEGAAARELAERDSLRISQGTTRYEREKQEMRRALRDTVREVVGPRGVLAWVKHLQEEIPENHSRALSKQGYRHLTYGQVMHLYGYLRQTATYGDNISRHGRVGQRVYIERHVLTAEDIKILNGMMRIYAERREALDAASRDITGFEMKSPDPWYMPVKIKTPTRSGLETVVSTVDAMPAVFSERRKHQLDVDEKADIMVMFNDRMEQSARVLGLGRTGLDVIHTWGSADVKDAITKARGKKFTTALVNHLTDWMNGGRPRLQNRAGEDERFLNGLRTVGTYTALWGNVLSGLKQTLSSPVFALAREVGERSIFQDMREFRSDAWKQAWRELAESDPYKARYGDVGVMEETKEAVQGGNMTGRLEAVLRAGMKPIELGDKTPGIIVGVGMYMAARDRMVDSGMDPVEAKRKAADLTMQAVEWTQQSGRTENQPEYARRGSSTTRLLMMFASSPMLQAGWEVQRIVEYREKREAFGKDSKEARDAATALRNAIIINHVVMPLAFQIASWGFQALLGRPPEEEDLPELLYACAIGPYSRLLVLSGLAHAAWNAAMGRSTYGRWNTVPSALVNLEQDVIDAVRLPIDLATWKPEEAWKDIDRFLRRNISIYRHGRTAWHNWAEAE